MPRPPPPQDEAAAGNGANSASYREVDVLDFGDGRFGVDLRRGDLDANDPAILIAAQASHQLGAFEAIDQTGDVRDASDHPVADLEGRQAARAGSAQDAQHVVLLLRQPAVLEQAGDGGVQQVVRLDQLEVELLTGIGGRPLRVPSRIC